VLAYLDANSGSLIASAIAAGFAGIAVVFKLGWSKTIGLFSPKQRRAAKARIAAEAAASTTSDLDEPATEPEVAVEVASGADEK
jgi:hypothetical protein